MPDNGDITILLRAWSSDPGRVLEQLTPLVYSELHKLASAYLRREKPGHTLQPTALVNEAYLRMIDRTMPDWEGRGHFFGIAAHIMRQVLTDFARRLQTGKRAGQRVTLDEHACLSTESAAGFLALNEAIEHLEAWDERKAKVIELKYFAGFSREEIAGSLDMSVATVKRDLALAEAFLRRELAGGAKRKMAAPDLL